MNMGGCASGKFKLLVLRGNVMGRLDVIMLPFGSIYWGVRSSVGQRTYVLEL